MYHTTPLYVLPTLYLFRVKRRSLSSVVFLALYLLGFWGIYLYTHLPINSGIEIHYMVIYVSFVVPNISVYLLPAVAPSADNGFMISLRTSAATISDVLRTVTRHN